MRYRLIPLISAVLISMALGISPAVASSAGPPPETVPEERVISNSSASATPGLGLELLTMIKSIKVSADKATVVIADGEKTHPIEIDYSAILSSGASGAGGKNGTGGFGGFGVGQIAAFLLGLAVVSRVIGLLRQVTGVRRR